jgi:hypothetical protein
LTTEGTVPGVKMFGGRSNVRAALTWLGLLAVFLLLLVIAPHVGPMP